MSRHRGIAASKSTSSLQDASRRETTDYIADLSGQLSRLASAHQLQLVASLLSLAASEARRISEHGDTAL